MLEDTRLFKSETVKVDWEYNEILKVFLNKYDIPDISVVDNNSNEASQENEVASPSFCRSATEYDDPYNEEEENENFQYPDDNEYSRDNYDREYQESPHNVFNRGHNMQDYQSNRQYNIFDPQQFPMPQQMHQNQNSLFNYDYPNGQMLYNMPNNNNIHNVPQPHPYPGIVPPMYHYQPAQLHPQIFGGQQHGAHIDNTTGETWIYFNPMMHTKKDNNKIEIMYPDGPQLVNVQYRLGNPNMFKTITTTAANNPTPFMDGREGHSILLTSFNKTVSSNNFGTTRRIPFETRLEPGSGLASTLDLIKRSDTQMAEAVFDHNTTDLHNLFPKSAFDAVSLADFTSGWNLTTSSFAAFAKDEDLKLSKLNTQLDINIDYKGYTKLQTEERDARRQLVNAITP